MNLFIKILQFLFTKKVEEKINTVDPVTHKQQEIPTGCTEQKVSLGRTVITGLTVASAALLATLETYEGVETKAYKDTGGVPTIGVGTTQYRTGDKAGQKVKMGDTITREQARQEVVAYLDEQGQAIIKSLQKPDGTYVDLYQQEFDVIQDFVYQYGIGNWNRSSIRTAYLNGEYIQACDNYLKYKFVGRTDCSKSNSGCRGVWLRSQKRREACLNATE